MALALATTSLLVLSASAAADFQLGLQDPSIEVPAVTPASEFTYHALQAIHGTTVRIELDWASVAPSGLLDRIGFDPSNPGDPRYHWAAADAEVEAAAAHHARVILEVQTAPQWAQQGTRPASMAPYPGTWNPDPAGYGLFTRAAALRYGGSFSDPAHPGHYLPRVSEWEIWNEPNLPYALGAPNLVEEYRALLNSAYQGIKSVEPTDVVATGGLAPVSFLGSLSVSPLAMGAQLMCLRWQTTAYVRGPSCPTPSHFDAFSIHPYTVSATPTKHAYHPDDALVGDMDKVAALVQAGDRLHTIRPAIQHGIWVTEWAWFTNPPDPEVGDPSAVAARYVAYSMYEMWRAGVSLVVWFSPRDPPLTGVNSPGFFYGGGLYASSGAPKLTLRAFSFPFVAGLSRRSGFAWGRVPLSRSVKVSVQRLVRRRWRQAAVTRTGTDGVFFVRFVAARGNGTYRAVVVHGPVSLAYNSRPIPARRTHAFYSG